MPIREAHFEMCANGENIDHRAHKLNDSFLGTNPIHFCEGFLFRFIFHSQFFTDGKWFLLSFSALSEDPEFTDIIENITVPAGRNVKLACSVKNLGTYKVRLISLQMNQTNFVARVRSRASPKHRHFAHVCALD